MQERETAQHGNARSSETFEAFERIPPFTFKLKSRNTVIGSRRAAITRMMTSFIMMITQDNFLDKNGRPSRDFKTWCSNTSLLRSFGNGSTLSVIRSWCLNSRARSWWHFCSRIIGEFPDAQRLRSQRNRANTPTYLGQCVATVEWILEWAVCIGNNLEGRTTCNNFLFSFSLLLQGKQECKLIIIKKP